MKYKITEKHLDKVTGDPSWPIPHYKFRDVGTIETEVTIQKGDYVDNRQVLEIHHTADGTKLIVSSN